MRARDVDATGHRLVVGRTLHDVGGHLTFSNTTKTDGSRRVVSLSPFLANMLADHLDGADPDALVFTAPDGGPVRHGLFVRRVFKRAVRGTPARPGRVVRNGGSQRAIPARPAVPGCLPAGKSNLRWHDLRHTCASLLIHSGASVLLVQKRLGHSSATTTLDRYGWLFPSAEAALADALEATYNADSPSVIPLTRAEAV